MIPPDVMPEDDEELRYAIESSLKLEESSK
jgi:hypothetical protein